MGQGEGKVASQLTSSGHACRWALQYKSGRQQLTDDSRTDSKRQESELAFPSFQYWADTQPGVPGVQGIPGSLCL